MYAVGEMHLMIDAVLSTLIHKRSHYGIKL